MVDELQPDFLQIDEETGVPFPEISIEFGEEGTGSLRSSPVGSGIEPPPPEPFEGDETFMRGVSSVYNFLAPSDEAMADLQAVQKRNQEIADQTGMPLKRLQQMMAYGDERSKILKDMGFKLYTPGQDFTRVRDFLYSEQQKAYEKRAAGVPHNELPLSEKIATFMMPIDVLDFIGLGVGVKALIKAGIKKFAGDASKKSVVDLVQDKELVGTLSDSETMSLFEDMKPVLPGEQRDAFLRFAKGKPTKKKTAGVIRTKDEAFSGGLPLKDFDESLLKTKPVKDAPPLKSKATTLTKDVKTKIGKKLEQTNFSKLDVKEENPYLKIVNEERAAAGYPPTNTPVSMHAKNLQKQGYITKEKQIEITNHSKKRSQTQANEAYMEKQLLQNTEKANKAVRLAKELQEASESQVVMPMATFYDQLVKAFPEDFAPLTSVSSKNKVITTLKTLKPEIKNYLARPGSEVGGLRYSDETLGVIEGGEEAARRSELVAKFKQTFPDEPITPLDDPLTDLSPLGEDVFDPRILDLKATDKAGQVDIISNPKFKFYEFLRDTLPTTDLDTLFDVVKIGDATDLANPAQKLFNQFKQIEDVRKKVSPLIRPFLKRIFPVEGGDRASVQIAHTFEKTKMKPPKREGVKKEIGYDPEKFIGQGVNPDFLYLDISPYNQGIQKTLENQANVAGKMGDYGRLAKIQKIMEIMGVEGQQAGITIGKKRKLSTKLRGLISELEKTGDPLPEKVDLLEAIKILESSGPEGYAYGGMVEDDLDIFEEQSNDLPEGSFEVASLKLPFFKLFGKAPVNEVAPIPTPKEKLANQTKKQKESLDREKEVRSQEDIFDPTPSEQVELDPTMPVAVTPITNQPMTSVFYSDIERAMTNAPEQFANKQEVLDFLNKNRIKKSEVDDYRIAALLKLYDDTSPIAKTEIISQVRSAPISGMRVHGTGSGSEIINPNGAKDTRYKGYAEDGLIPDTQRERVLYINRDKLPGDTGEYPQSMFGGETIQRHDFGIPNEENTYIVGWTRLSDRYGFVPPKVEGPQTKINVRQLTREKTKNERSLQGLYAEARSKIERLANQRGMSQRDINDIDIDFGSDIPKLSVIAKYADQLDEISPGLVNQMDELVVRNRDLQEQITKASGVDPSGVVRVTFADEIQSDLLQAAAGRKQQLAAALRKIQEEGAANTNLQGLNRVAQATIDFYEKNKSVFRPLTKTEGEVDVIAQRINKLETEVDNIVNNYIATREIDQTQIDRLAGLLNDNINNMLDEVLSVDSNTMAGLFPDLPFKNREEWADALIKKDLYELAYRKFVLKDPDASAYYAVSPSKYVSKRYNFTGDASTSAADRAADKQRRFDAFKRNGQFIDSQYKGIGMDEFYGGPDSVSNVIDNSGTAATNPNFGKPKHYTSTIETILKRQAQSNNSEMITMPVQLKGGRGSTQYRVTDQNGNMVATLTNEDQARQLLESNPNYRIQPISIPNKKDMEPVFAIKITPEMLEPYKTHKAQGGLVEHIDIFEV